MPTDPQETWDLFAAAWLARAGDPRTHGENERDYAARQTDMASGVATRMLQIRAMHFGTPLLPSIQNPVQPTSPQARVMQPETQRAIRQALTEAGVEVSRGPVGNPDYPGGLPPPMTGPSSSPQNSSAHTGGLCVRGFNGTKRGGGQDCPGAYDEQGICSVCRLPASTPAERVLQGQPPVPPGAAE